MQQERRKFIKDIGLIAGGMALLPSSDIFDTVVNFSKKRTKFGLQLYTLRDDLPKDVKGVLRKVAQAGYKQIESYEGPQGMWWGMGHRGFSQYVEDLGMKVISSHCDIFKNFEQKADEAAEIGLKYLICPWLGKQSNMDKYKEAAANFNKKGEICRNKGIGFGYHNHAYSFEAVDGIFPQDIMMGETDPELVSFEMDMFWVHAAGQDIGQWLRKYEGRFKLCHIKDFSKYPVSDNSSNSVNLGKGVIDWKNVLHEASERGMEYYIVEQEAYPNTTPIQAIRDNAAYMKNLRF
ncbi:MAG: sugar phosphate isomerase/epimerase [Saprospiraceae bacterium]|nr:sugar phosphate isomerase/epimerase [Saprospiraceae bacterium]